MLGTTVVSASRTPSHASARPAEATGLSVELSSSAWAFVGNDVSDGRVGVRYTGGRLRIEIDRALGNRVAD